MKRQTQTPVLSAIFVDYDNIYMSLRRKNEDAAKRFSKDAALWLRALEQGRLVNPNNPIMTDAPRRIVLNRCYGNPVPRRNPSDNATDMSSFPFVRHHFLRAGFEVVDCPPLTSQQKNAADIRMVMDLRDYLIHETYFDEFIILSGDADFTPVLHRLRQHARRTVIYSNDHTAAAYAAICDGEVREADLIDLLMEGQHPLEVQSLPVHATPHVPEPIAQNRIEDLRLLILSEVAAGIRAASGPVPLEALADRAIRAIGHERTIGTSWAGANSFRELLRMGLPQDLRLTEQPPFYAFDPQRHGVPQAAPTPSRDITAPMHIETQLHPKLEPIAALTSAPAPIEQRIAPLRPAQALRHTPAPGPAESTYAETAPVTPAPAQPAPLSARPASPEPILHRAPTHRAPPAAPKPDPVAAMHNTIARIHEACQAPPLAPLEYRAMFEVAAQEINENGLAGAQTLTAITQRAQERGLNIRREDVRFVLDVVSEPDPWFEQGATPNLFAGRFRNFVVARCREQGLSLSAEELDLIDAWFTGANLPHAVPARQAVPAPAPAQEFVEPPALVAAARTTAAPREQTANRWWASDEPRASAPDLRSNPPAGTDDDFPRIVRTRQRN